jgi:glutamate synthase (NADPH/NADH) small chain
MFTGGDRVRGRNLVVTAISEGRQTAEGILNQLEVTINCIVNAAG